MGGIDYSGFRRIGVMVLKIYVRPVERRMFWNIFETRETIPRGVILRLSFNFSAVRNTTTDIKREIFLISYKGNKNKLGRREQFYLRRESF